MGSPWLPTGSYSVRMKRSEDIDQNSHEQGPVAPHKLIVGQNEASRLQEAFQTPPGFSGSVFGPLTALWAIGLCQTFALQHPKQNNKNNQQFSLKIPSNSSLLSADAGLLCKYVDHKYAEHVQKAWR